MDGRFLNKNGDMQQRFIGGSGSFNNVVRVSRKNINWDISDITIGANSHVGPIEVDLHMARKGSPPEATGFFPTVIRLKLQRL